MNNSTKLLAALAVSVGTVLSASGVAHAQADSSCYEYDELGRLKDSRYSNGSKIDYSIDEHGNRTSRDQADTGAAACTAPVVTIGSGVPDLPSNSSPTATDDMIVVDGNQTYTFSLLANDTDADGDELLIAFANTNFYRGTTVIAADRKSLTYTSGPSLCTDPDPTPYGFEYVVGDGNGGVASANYYITYNPTPFSTTPNTSPVANGDSATLAIIPGNVRRQVI